MGACMQDDREVKRMRRKQSNRESARRSRLRKQAECETLSGRVEELMSDNARLREANRLLQARVDTLTAQQQADMVGFLSCCGIMQITLRIQLCRPPFRSSMVHTRWTAIL